MTAAKSQELVAREAFDAQARIQVCVKEIRRRWIELAADLYEFHENRHWQDLGHPSFESWLRQPDIELERRMVFQLIATWRTLVVDKGIKPARLAELEASKVAEIVPAVRRGQVDIDKALSDAEVLPRDDLRTLYHRNGRPDTDTKIRTDDEPEWEVCRSCGRPYEVVAKKKGRR